MHLAQKTPHLDNGSSSARKPQRWLLLALLGIMALSILGALLPLNQTDTTLSGFPTMIVWLTGCFVLYAIVTIAAYLLLFRHWRAQ